LIPEGRQQEVCWVSGGREALGVDLAAEIGEHDAVRVLTVTVRDLFTGAGRA
jgi:hypothetical protein